MRTGRRNRSTPPSIGLSRSSEVSVFRAFAAVSTLLWLPVCGTVDAQTSTGYPQRPVRVVVPFPPGGGADVTLRMVADPLKAQLGQPLAVDNRGGASTILGTEIVAKAKPDGYTILIATTTFAIN